MGIELASVAWVEALAENVNASADYREAGRGWRWPVVLTFTECEDGADRHVWLDLYDGECREAVLVGEDRAGEAPYRISASVERWTALLDGRLEPVKALVLGRVRLDGNLLVAMRYMPAAKALIDCACMVDTDLPAR